jgi:hypothetical protein
MESTFISSLAEQGFNIILLCVAVYYMHKRVEKIELQKEGLTEQLIDLQQKTIEALDRLSDQLKENKNAIEGIRSDQRGS